MIYPPAKKSSKLVEILPGLSEVVDKEHKRLLARKSIIEKRKEEQERQLLEMVFKFKLPCIELDNVSCPATFLLKLCFFKGTRGGVKKAAAAEEKRRGRAEETCC